MASQTIFICKADSQVGWGHLMRVIALYDLCETHDGLQLHLFIEGDFDALVAQVGHRRCKFFTDFHSILADLEQLESYQPSVVLDHPYARGSQIDRLVDMVGPIILFYSKYRETIRDRWVRYLIAPRSDGIEFEQSLKHKLLMGLEFTPLRPSLYDSRQKREYRPIQRVIMCFGGAQHRATVELALITIRDLGFRGHVTLILGAGCEQPFNFNKSYEFELEVLVGVEADDLVSLIDEADVGLISSGTIAQECFSRGLVCGLVDVADDQVGLSGTYADMGLCLTIDRAGMNGISQLLTLSEEGWSCISERLQTLDYTKAARELVSAVTKLNLGARKKRSICW